MSKKNLDLDLIPVFAEGEILLIQRTVSHKNVLMVVEVRNPCTLTADRMVLTAVVKNWGISPYADGRIQNQRDTIDRLMKLLQEAQKLALQSGYEELIDLLYKPMG